MKYGSEGNLIRQSVLELCWSLIYTRSSIYFDFLHLLQDVSMDPCGKRNPLTGEVLIFLQSCNVWPKLTIGPQPLYAQNRNYNPASPPRLVRHTPARASPHDIPCGEGRSHHDNISIPGPMESMGASSPFSGLEPPTSRSTGVRFSDSGPLLSRSLKMLDIMKELLPEDEWQVPEKRVKEINQSRCYTLIQPSIHPSETWNRTRHCQHRGTAPKISTTWSNAPSSSSHGIS